MERTIHVPEWAVRFADDFTGLERFARPINPAEEPTIHVQLPDDAYYEYGFFDAEDKLRGDPEAEEAAKNPWFPGISAITGPAFKPGEFSAVNPDIATGSTERARVSSDLFPEERRVIVYTPAGYENAALPTVYVQDGVAFYRIGKLPAMMEALLAQQRIEPARLVFIEPGDRPVEYGYNEAYTEFVTGELPLWLRDEYDVQPGAYYVGASLGGLASVLAAAENSTNALGLATFSGAFLGTPENREFYKTDDSWLLEEIDNVLPKLPKWYLQTGKLEWLYDVNKNIARQVATAGHEHKYVARSAGHNWGNWLHSVAPALEYLLSRS